MPRKPPLTFITDDLPRAIRNELRNWRKRGVVPSAAAAQRRFDAEFSDRIAADWERDGYSEQAASCRATAAAHRAIADAWDALAAKENSK